MTPKMQQMVEDMAAVSGLSVDEVVDAIRAALVGEVPPISQQYVEYPRWWKRLVPGWKRRWQSDLLAALEAE